jgi:glucose/mannose-6-phosphate isomerase
LIDLDDRQALRRADPARMLDAVLGLPRDCQEGYRLGRDAENLPSAESLSAVVVCGMGGSGVAGDVLAALYGDRLGLPILVAKSPILSAFCDKDTLVVCSSYSGTTAETLACFEEARIRGCRVVAITAGGELARRAREGNHAVVTVPGGLQPRAAIGFLAFGVLGALEGIGVLPTLGPDVERCVGVLERLSSDLGSERPAAGNTAKGLALALAAGRRYPVIWGAAGLGAVAAARWKTQLNENAKVPAFSAALPELDHNEVVGWSDGTGERFFLVTLRHNGEHPDIAARFEVTVNVVARSGLEHREVRADGGSPLADLMSLMMVGDAVSVYLGCLRGFDPTPIEAIARIKHALEGRSP